MAKERKTDVAERLRLACELFEAGVEMMRQKLRRDHPATSDEELDRLLQEWLVQRPGAEFGDAVGTKGQWPRRKGAQ